MTTHPVPWWTPPIVKWWITTDTKQKISDFISLALIGGLALYAANGSGSETREEKTARLSCEMAAMKPVYEGFGHPLSAADAEAYCAKEMEAERLWKHK